MSVGGVSPVPREARAFQGEPAGLVTRVVANVIDALVAGALALGGYLLLNAVRFMLDPRGFQAVRVSSLLSLTYFLSVLVLYFAVAWTVVGRTYGCHLMGLRVIDRRGRRPGPVVALARAALCVFLPIGLLWCAVSRRRRSVQDVLLRTSVVYDWMPTVEPPDRAR